MLSKSIGKITEKQFHQKQDVSKNTISQINFLQNTLGNQKVQELIHSGALAVDSETPGRLTILNNKQKEQETELMLADREALNPEIDKVIKQNQTLAEELKTQYPDKDIYVNVKTVLHFVKTPGDNPHEFYHYTELADVSFSLLNINKTGKTNAGNRGYTIEVTDSFLYRGDQEIITSREEPETEEALVTEEEITEAETETESNNTLI